MDLTKTKELNFRIVELEASQVLVMKDFDEDDIPLLCIVFFVEGAKVSQKLGFEDEGKRDYLFESIEDSQVQRIVEEAAIMFGE